MTRSPMCRISKGMARRCCSNLGRLGGTSAGKTTILKVAASVCGYKKIPNWRTTANGLEAIACAHSQMLLPLDEIGQADSKDVGNIAYMLANGLGKTRMTKALQNRKPKTWQLLFLSSGEISLADYVAQAGIRLKGGQEVRMPDIPAVPPGSTMGAFEDVHGAESSKVFAEALDYAAGKYKGVVIDYFLTWLVEDVAKGEEFAGALAKKVYHIRELVKAEVKRLVNNGPQPSPTATTTKQKATTTEPDIETMKMVGRLQADPNGLQLCARAGIAEGLKGKALCDHLFEHGHGAKENSKLFDVSVASRMVKAIAHMDGEG